jgi:hypothetical protein
MDAGCLSGAIRRRDPHVYWRLKKEHDRVTYELIGEAFGGVTGRTVQDYVRCYEEDGNRYPPLPVDD